MTPRWMIVGLAGAMPNASPDTPREQCRPLGLEGERGDWRSAPMCACTHACRLCPRGPFARDGTAVRTVPLGRAARIQARGGPHGTPGDTPTSFPSQHQRSQQRLPPLSTTHQLPLSLPPSHPLPTPRVRVCRGACCAPTQTLRAACSTSASSPLQQQQPTQTRRQPGGSGPPAATAEVGQEAAPRTLGTPSVRCCPPRRARRSWACCCCCSHAT